MAELFGKKDIRAFRRWFLTLDNTWKVRKNAFTRGAINNSQEKILASLDIYGPSTHNGVLLDIVQKAGSSEDFKRLAEAVKDLGEEYKPKYEQLMAILVSGEDSSTIPGSPDALFWKSDQQDREYNMPWGHPGIALIINNKDFPYPDDVRKGTGKDCDALVKLWQHLEFDTHVEHNLSGKDMKTWLEKNAKNGKPVASASVVICILSHGGENTVCGSDGEEVPIDDLVELFHNDKVHQSLVGKPKMFFIQACRGGRKAHGIVDMAGGGTSSNADASATACSKKVHTSTADVLVCFSTAPGHLSWRTEERGSWYIQCLVDVFYEHHKEEHVLDMMTRVTGALAKKCTDEHHQTPSFRSQLKAKVFLRWTAYQPKLVLK